MTTNANLNSLSQINGLVKLGFTLNSLNFVPYPYILPLLLSGSTLYKVTSGKTISTIRLENNKIKEENKFCIKVGQTPRRIRSHNPLFEDFIKNQIGFGIAMDINSQTKYYINLPNDLNIYEIYKNHIRTIT